MGVCTWRMGTSLLNTLVTHSWTRCLCACPAVGDSNNSYCVPVKAERLRDSLRGILGGARFYWLKDCCSSRVCVTRTTPDRGRDARSPSIIVHARRLFRFRQLHQSHRFGMKVGVAWNNQGILLWCKQESQSKSEITTDRTDDQRPVPMHTQFRVQDFFLDHGKPK